MPGVSRGANAGIADRVAWNGAGMLEDMSRNGMRAADADRQQVAEHLRAALNEGRLDLHEYDERLRQAYEAKTYGDLDGLLTDLPNAAPLARPATSAVQSRAMRDGSASDGATATWLRHVWGSWAQVAAVLTVIWAVSSIGAMGVQDYWPVWVIGPWGLFLAWQTASGLAGREPRRYAELQEYERLAKQHKRERKALEAEAIARGELPAKPTKQQRRAFAAEAMARGQLRPKPIGPDSAS
jgi:hypothetical protein